MQAGVGLLVTDVMPIYMIMPRYSHNYAQFCQLLNSNLFTHRRILMLSREATSETYGPRVYLPSYYFPINLLFLFCNLYFPIYTTKYQKYLSYYLYQISLLHLAVKGLTTPLSRWRVVSYWIDTLVLKNLGKYLHYCAASPFPLQGKTNTSSRGSSSWSWSYMFACMISVRLNRGRHTQGEALGWMNPFLNCSASCFFVDPSWVEPATSWACVGFSLEEERVMQQSSISISLSFWEPRYQSSRRLHASPLYLHKQSRTLQPTR